MPGASAGSAFEQQSQSLSAASGGAHDDHFFSGFSHGVRGLRQNGVGGELGLDNMAGRVARRAARGPRLSRRRRWGSRFFKKLPRAQPRLGDDFDSAVFKGRKVLCAPSSARLEQMTTGIGCWVMIFQKCQAVHARHLDVERDHIGDFFGDAIGGNEGIGGRAHHLDLGISWTASC